VAASRGKIIAAFAAVYVIWGSTYLAIRFAIETLPPFLMASSRFVVAGALLYAWSMLRGERMPTRAEWKAATVVGALLLLGGNGAVVWAEQVVPSGIAALLVSVMPCFMVLLDWLWHGSRRPGVRTVLGLALGFAGLLLLAGPGAFAGGEPVSLVGTAVLMLGCVCWAVGSLYSKRAPTPSAPLLATGMQMLTGGALLAVAGALAGEVPRLDLAQVTTSSWLALLYLMVFGSIIGYSAYVWLLRVVSPAHVSTYAYVNPIVAVLLGWALAGEALSARIGIAGAVIISGVVLITTDRAARGDSAA